MRVWRGGHAVATSAQATGGAWPETRSHTPDLRATPLHALRGGEHLLDGRTRSTCFEAEALPALWACGFQTVGPPCSVILSVQGNGLRVAGYRFRSAV